LLQISPELVFVLVTILLLVGFFALVTAITVEVLVVLFEILTGQRK
jgi:hypothetical protein